MRYRTVGDWVFGDRGELLIQVADTTDWKSNFCVAIHELVEAMLCRRAGIAQLAVDMFDKAYTGTGEPGDEPDAPYHTQHQWATAIEQVVALSLNLSWRKHESNVEFAYKRIKQ